MASGNALRAASLQTITCQQWTVLFAAQAGYMPGAMDVLPGAALIFTLPETRQAELNQHRFPAAGMLN